MGESINCNQKRITNFLGERLRIVVESGLMVLLTSDLLLSLSYGLKSTESATSIMVPNSEGAAYFGRFHPNGLLPAHHLRKVNLSGDRLLGAGVEAF